MNVEREWTVRCMWLQAQNEFGEALKEEGLELTKEMGIDKKHRYLLIHTPFWRLCVEAERVRLKMPLKNVRNKPINSNLYSWKLRNGL